MENEAMELNPKYALWQKAMSTPEKTLIGFSKNLPVGKTGKERLNICNNIPSWMKGKEKIAYLTYGRYQPGHIGHRSLFNAMVLEAKKEKMNNMARRIQKMLRIWRGRVATNLKIQAKLQAKQMASSTSSQSKTSVQSNKPVSKTPTKGRTTESKSNSESFTHSTPVETKAKKKSIGIKTNIFVFVSPTGGEEWGIQNPAGRTNNPLEPAAKVDLLFKQNEDLPLFIINTKLIPGVQSIVGAIRLLLVCYDKVKVRLGDEDVEGFTWLKKTFGDQIVDITSSSSKPRSDDDPVASMSASKIRAHAKLFEEIRDEHWNFIVGALRPDGADVSNDDIIEIIERIKLSDKIGGKRKTKRRTKRKSKRRTKRKTKRKTKRRTKRRTKRKKKKTKRRVKKRKRTKRK